MLASPALNPAAIALTFMLFEANIAAARAVLALSAVLLIGPAVERIFPAVTPDVPPEATSAGEQPSGVHPLKRFLDSLVVVSVRTLPGLIAGLLLSMLIVQWLPAGALASGGARLATILFIATVAVPLALPTFLEIPLALSLLAAGFPAGAAVALLFAGPIINLPSLFSVARVSGWKPAAVIAALVWVLATAGGLLTR
jgi:uncharacterized membrane protein YraQ (UPF0718 family)